MVACLVSLTQINITIILMFIHPVFSHFIYPVLSHFICTRTHGECGITPAEKQGADGGGGKRLQKTDLPTVTQLVNEGATS